jgi:hypothetical protein
MDAVVRRMDIYGAADYERLDLNPNLDRVEAEIRNS